MGRAISLWHIVILCVLPACIIFTKLVFFMRKYYAFLNLSRFREADFFLSANNGQPARKWNNYIF